MNKNALSFILCAVAILCAFIAGYYRDKRVDKLQAYFLTHCRQDSLAWDSQNYINKAIIDILKDGKQK